MTENDSRGLEGHVPQDINSSPMRIDINCDMGESFGIWRLGQDEDVMPHITSANIACGSHAGDPSVMRRTIRLAKAARVEIGAHPGFPDLIGFGRRELDAAPAEVEDSVVCQIGAIAAMAEAEGMRLQHVKPHGALFNMAARDRALADAIARAVASVNRSLILFGLPGSQILEAGRASGLRVASEVFADRAYDPNGSLTSRRRPGAVIHDPGLVVARAVRMVVERTVVATDGTVLPLEADTICVHGDTPGADLLVRRLRTGLEGAGVRVLPVGQPAVRS
jgi:5-oxoprolinase (ATP-hydrolysing) subunit A